MRRVGAALILLVAVQPACQRDVPTAPQRFGWGAVVAATSPSRLVFTSDRDGNAEIYVMNADGSAQTRLTNSPGADASPSWSPDGQRIVFMSYRAGTPQIFVMNADGSGPTQLTTSAGGNDFPSWSPDGRQIAFTSHRDGHDEIYAMNVDGSAPTRLTNNPEGNRSPNWSPDGLRIAFTSGRDTSDEIYVMNADGSAQTRLTTSGGSWPTWSPDGGRIAFTSVRDGNPEIYVMAADGSVPTRITSNPAFDVQPSWSGDGARIAFVSYRDPGGEIYVMAPDGSALTRLTNNSDGDIEPHWSPGPPITSGGVLAFATQPPASVEVGAVVSPPIQVAVQDALGNVVPGAADAVTLALGANSTGARLVGNTTVQAIDGIATFDDVRVDRVGNRYTLVATAPGLASTTSTAFVVVTRAVLAFVTQPPAQVEGDVDMSPPVRVAVQDSLGTPLPGDTTAVTLAIGLNPSGGRLLGTTTVRAVDGVATFADVRVDRPGTGYTLVATGPGLVNAASTLFSVHLTFLTISARYYHTCGVTTSHAAYCWGSNAWGQLGDGTPSDGSATPVLVTGDLNFTLVSVGQTHTCGLTTGGTAYCWGGSFFGQVGDGTTTSRASPVPVGGAVRFTQVSVGNYHSCGVATSGEGYCWGENFPTGKLGDGTTMDRAVPTPVLSVLTFVAIDAGRFHTCGLTVQGTAACWGSNSNGQLGDGISGVNQQVPLPVASLTGFATVSAGDVHTCGVTAGGAASCWGRNTSGELGDGTTTGHTIPQSVAGAFTFSFVESGASHTCGVTTSHAALCWGDNAAGELGDGTTVGRTTPVPVTGGLSFVTVSSGTQYSCGVTTSGAAYCWGTNGLGQLGTGTGSSVTPVRVAQ
jgi:Tol biopolymer transport system component/alpha-tubulin suppressor-like RCC1 family protein